MVARELNVPTGQTTDRITFEIIKETCFIERRTRGI